MQVVKIIEDHESNFIKNIFHFLPLYSCILSLFMGKHMERALCLMSSIDIYRK